MKPTVRVLLLVLLAALALPAQELSKEDFEKGVKHLTGTRDAIVEATKSFSDAQWNFKTAPERWSVAECLEHITVTEEFLFKMVSDDMAKPAAESAEPASERAADDKVLAMVTDRSQRFQAPEPVRPSGRWATPQATLKEFLELRARTLEYLKSTPGLRANVSESPLGRLDAYQRLLFISGHSERHFKQMQEVMADANFPKE
ncbi:MAG: DinB family protein [Candidatus Acidiferrales bacterium]